jgi:hypothetical protein
MIWAGSRKQEMLNQQALRVEKGLGDLGGIGERRALVVPSVEKAYRSQIR